MSKCLQTILVILGLTFWGTSNAQSYDYLKKQNFSERYAYFDSLQTFSWKTNTGLPKLKEIYDWALKNHQEEIALEAEMALNTEDPYLLSVPIEKVDSIFGRIIEKARNHGWIYIEIQAMHLRGSFLWVARKDKARAYRDMLEAYSRYQRLSAKEFNPKIENLAFIGGMFYQYQDYENAIPYLKEAFAINDQSYMHEMVSVANTLGLCYRYMGQYETANYYFNIALERATQKKDLWWASIIKGNIGISYYQQHRFEEAIPLLRQDIDTSIARNDYLNASNSLIILADTYKQQGNYKVALEYAQQAQKCGFVVVREKNYRYLKKIYSLLNELYDHFGDQKTARIYADSALIAADSVNAIDNKHEIARLEQRFDLERYETELSQIKAEARFRNLVWFSIITMAALVGAFLIYRQRQRHRQHRAELELEAEQARRKHMETEQELLLATRKLESFTQNLSEKDKLLEEFEAQLNAMNQPSAKSDENQQIILQLKKSRILTEDEWDEFTVLFEKVHRNFFDNIRKEIPDISPAELRYAALYKLNASNRQIASVSGVGVDAVRMNKYRLLRRLNLSEDDDFDKWIERL